VPEKQVILKLPINSRPVIKLCYIKFGNVCDELEHCLTALPITGGHYHYVYSTHKILGDTSQIKYLSLNNENKCVKTKGRVAKTLKTVNAFGSAGKVIKIIHGVLLLLLELLVHRPDHILMVRTYGLMPCYLLSKLLGAEFTVSIHNDLNLGKKWLLPIEQLVLKKADSLICHGPYLSNQAKRIRSGKENIIEYNASSSDMVQESSCKNNKKLPVSSEKRLITYIGRMETEKGILDLFEAYKSTVKVMNSPVELCFAGAGSQTEFLNRQIGLANLSDTVHVLGELSRQDVAALLKISWVAVTPTQKSFPEGRCMAAMEALSLGIPLIAPKLGPFKYLIKQGVNGLFFAPNSIKDLAKQLGAIQSPDIRHLLANGAKAESLHFSQNLLSYGEAVKRSLGLFKI